VSRSDPVEHGPAVVRAATRADLDHVAPIEAAADRQFVPVLGETGWGPPSSGAWRFGARGFLLIAGDPPVGFAHVLELDAEGPGPATLVHLEQLAVRPEAQRRGTGSALVRAAMTRAREEGHDRLSLCTFARVPWNAPFYQRLGFTVVERPTGVLATLRRRERDLGLDRLGERVVMAVELRGQAR
jgi:GNAT superfamily N-acetyltransferase